MCLKGIIVSFCVINISTDFSEFVCSCLAIIIDKVDFKAALGFFPEELTVRRLTPDGNRRSYRLFNFLVTQSEPRINGTDMIGHRLIARAGLNPIESEGEQNGNEDEYCQDTCS